MRVPGYEQLALIDGGRYSSVYRAIHVSLQRTVAIKVMTTSAHPGSPNLAAYREVQGMSVTKHPNVVRLHEVIQLGDDTCLIMEFVPFNVSRALQNNKLPESVVKGFMLMLFRGLAHIHELGLIHRDIKPQNLLITEKGVLKICDLGLCRISESTPHEWTLCVGTSFYRAPELLLGDKDYNTSMDIWATGCVLAELLNGVPLFPGDSDLEMLGLISKLMGAPSEKIWSGVSKLSDFGKIEFAEKEPADIRTTFTLWSDEAVDLFKKLIVYEPGKRMTAREALHHRWFSCEPAPVMAPYDGRSFDFFNTVTI